MIAVSAVFFGVVLLVVVAAAWVSDRVVSWRDDRRIHRVFRERMRVWPKPKRRYFA